MKEESQGIKLKKSDRTKKKIQEVFLTLMRKVKWDKITVKDLCAAADITRGTFYQHYDDIYDLMEQIQKELLNELEADYSKVNARPVSNYSIEDFETEFDYTPPAYMDTWFRFCKTNRFAIIALIDPVNGDPYFVTKLKAILSRSINRMMDDDRMPGDGLREHFVKIFLEMHFLAARTWLADENDEFLSRQEIINLLNTMRVGANYLTYKRFSSPDFSIRMALNDDF